MTKLILSLTLAAFALTPALQAGEGKDCCPATKAAAQAKATGTCSAQAKSTEAKSSCPLQAKNATAQAGCCPSKAAKKTTVAKKTPVQSPKAAQL